MKILHTSDWHIGSTLYGKRRYDEYQQFLTWLNTYINDNSIDVLLIAGDIFDTALPSNTAQKMYYQFLWNLTQSSCKHIVITGGNHDSATFLNAPKELLKSLNIHIIGAITENLEDEIINLNINNEKLTILAVPYLRERDLRQNELGESYEDRNKKIIAGIQNHYQQLTNLVQTYENPIIAMGHLFIAGSKTQNDDGERELYIGSLAQIGSNIFSEKISYVALGHIHSAQKINNQENIRYSGSPLAMSFAEHNQNKKMILLETITSQNTNAVFNITEINIPYFQQLLKIKGNIEFITNKIQELKETNSSIWLEIEYTGKEKILNLKETIFSLIENSKLEVLKLKNPYNYPDSLTNNTIIQNLEETKPITIFEEKLKDTSFSDEQKNALIHCFNKILQQVEDTDINE